LQRVTDFNIARLIVDDLLDRKLAGTHVDSALRAPRRA